MSSDRNWLIEPIEDTDAYNIFIKVFGDPTVNQKYSTKEWAKRMTEFSSLIGTPLSLTKSSSKLKTISLCSNFNLGFIRAINHCSSWILDVGDFINSLIYQESYQEDAKSLQDGNWRVWVLNDAALLYRYLGHTLELNWCWFF